VSGRDSGRWQEFRSGSSFERLVDQNDPAQTRIKLNLGKVYRAGYKYVESGKRLNDYAFSNRRKYTAVNTNNKPTIEFRLFTGAEEFTECMKYLEFVDALCKYTETGEADYTLAKLVSVDGFSEWLTKNGNRYPNLCLQLDVKHDKSVDTSNYSYPEWKERQIKKGKIKCA
jgi:hypothetical protein